MFPDAGTCCGAPDAICCYEFTTEHCNLRLAILDGHVSGWADDLCGSSLRTLRRHLEVPPKKNRINHRLNLVWLASSVEKY